VHVEGENVMQNVKVIYHREPEGWWAESPDVAGYTAADDAFGELRSLVHEGLPFVLDIEADDLQISEQMADGAPIGAPAADVTAGVVVSWLRSIGAATPGSFALPSGSASSALLVS